MKSIAIIIITMWIVFIVNALIPYDLRDWGQYPRTYYGIIGIFTVSFLHADIDHIITNTIWLSIGAILARGIVARNHVPITYMLLISGFINWIIGTPGNHVGASGLGCALFGYAAIMALRNNDVIALIIIISISPIIISGLIPQSDISFTGHISGLIAGVCIANSMTKTINKNYVYGNI